MQDLYELKEMLCDELKKYGKKNEISSGNLDTIDKLAHTVKNLDKIIEGMDGSYGMEDYGRSYARRRRDSMGRYSREGYSRDHEMVSELRELMHDAPNESVRQDIQRIINKVENM